MHTISFLTKVLVFSLLCVQAQAEVLFEGYYKLSWGDQHIGYIIQRYDLNSTDKTFSHISYFYAKTSEGTTTESLNAKSSDKLAPISYQYTSLDGGKSKAIDAIVKEVKKAKKLVIKIVDNGKASVKEVGLNDKVFLSSFLSNLMLKNPKGIQVGNKFEYEGVAEEDAAIEKGVAFVKEQVKERGLDCFRILNTFKKEEFVSWVNFRGEMLKINVPKKNITAELVADKKDATKEHALNESSIKLLFGNVPEGKINLLHKK